MPPNGGVGGQLNIQVQSTKSGSKDKSEGVMMRSCYLRAQVR